MLNIITRINLVYAAGGAYTIGTAIIAFFASSISNKLINDSCIEWRKATNSTDTSSAKQFFEDATKQEICKWGPFITDVAIVAGTFQVFGMGLFGKGFRVTDLTKVQYGTGGLSSCLMNLINQQNDLPTETDGFPFGDLPSDLIGQVTAGINNALGDNGDGTVAPAAGDAVRSIREMDDGVQGFYILDIRPDILSRVGNAMQRVNSFMSDDGDNAMLPYRDTTAPPSSVSDSPLNGVTIVSPDILSLSGALQAVSGDDS